jgi:feruloyl esterase
MYRTQGEHTRLEGVHVMAAIGGQGWARWGLFAMLSAASWGAFGQVSTNDSASSDAVAASPGTDAVATSRCHALLALQSAQFLIRSAQVRTATFAGRSLTFCEIDATAHPTAGSHIGIVVRMPDPWNGKLLGLGGGGMAGNVALESQNPLPGALDNLAKGYATAQNDTGHASPSLWDTSWAKLPDGNPNWDGLEDFAFRAVHLMTVWAKKVVQQYYDAPARQSYFMGCSTGGRQALMEVQRFPQDYDGVVSGAPVYDQRVAASMVATSRALIAGGRRLTQHQTRLVNDAVLRACDADDGLKDGIVGNPLRCEWDPAQLACKPGQSEDQCLSTAQVEGLRRAYSNIRAPDGSVAVFGLPRGSELTSVPLFASLTDDLPNAVGMSNLKAVQFEDPHYDFANWDPPRDLDQQRTTPYAFMLDATNPDISPFLLRGGKLILWHGLYDGLPRAADSIDYYQTMSRVTGVQLKARGSSLAVTDSARLFLAQGVAHCFGGPGADTFDMVSTLDAWREKGQAPERIPARRATADAQPHAPIERRVGTRPLCAFPALPRYRAGTDPTLESSFACSAQDWPTL